MVVSVTGPRAVNELGGPVIPGNSEQVWARVKLPGDKPLNICSFYQPPSSGMNPLCDLDNSIEKITQPGQN